MGAKGPLLHRAWELSHGVHGSDGQGNTNLPPPTIRAQKETAAEMIVRLAHEYPRQLTLVPVAPLTNIAAALMLDPSIAHLYKEVVLMGGNFLAPGNITKWGEANIVHDPEAAQIVFEAGWPITAVGLDVTLKTMLSAAYLDELASSPSRVAQHLSKISQFYLERYTARRGRRECSMHDALALAIAADRSLVTHSVFARVDVELKGDHTRGMTVADLRVWAPKDEANAHVVLDVDVKRFVDRWMEVVCRGSA
jgi:purine nucleosidase